MGKDNDCTTSQDKSWHCRNKDHKFEVNALFLFVYNCDMLNPFTQSQPIKVPCTEVHRHG